MIKVTNKTLQGVPVHVLVGKVMTQVMIGPKSSIEVEKTTTAIDNLVDKGFLKVSNLGTAKVAKETETKKGSGK